MTTTLPAGWKRRTFSHNDRTGGYTVSYYDGKAHVAKYMLTGYGAGRGWLYGGTYFDTEAECLAALIKENNA